MALTDAAIRAISTSGIQLNGAALAAPWNTLMEIEMAQQTPPPRNPSHRNAAAGAAPATPRCGERGGGHLKRPRRPEDRNWRESTAEEIVAKLRQIDILVLQRQTVVGAVRSFVVTSLFSQKWRERQP